MTEDPNDNQQQLDVGSTPPTPPADEGEGARGRGRPSLAELQARKAELDGREEELKRRELELELAAAEANQGFRERDLAAREQQLAERSAAGRRPARSGTVRSEEVTQPVRGRKFKGGAEMPNKFHIPTEDIPEGTSYQWNNYTVFGKADASYDSFMQQQGWEPVDASRHPHLMPPGYKGPIIVDGQILMERPAELTNEALSEDLARARGEVAAKEEQLYGARPDTPIGRNLGVKKGFERPEAELPRTYQYETPGQGGAIIE